MLLAAAVDPLSLPPFWTNLLSGAIGAVVGAIASVLVLFFANGFTRRENGKAIEVQRELFEREAEISQERFKIQLAAESNEARRARETDAVGELIRYLTTLLHERPDDLSFVPDLVRRCDQLTLSAEPEVAQRWRRTVPYDHLGVSRHPLAQALTVAIALQQTRLEVVSILSNRLGGAPRLILLNEALPRRDEVNWRTLALMVNDFTPRLLAWPTLQPDEKIHAFDSEHDWICAVAARFIAGVGELEQSIPEASGLSRGGRLRFEVQGGTAHVRLLNRVARRIGDSRSQSRADDIQVEQAPSDPAAANQTVGSSV